MTKILNESGKGYWMEGTGTLRANPSHSSMPLVVSDRIGGGTSSSDCSAIGCDLYNGTVTGETACSLTANTGASANHAGPSVIVLNDQGGSVMEVSEKAATLRAQDHGHPPIICGFTNRSYESGDIAETLRAESHGALPMVAYCFEPGIAKRLGGHSRYTPDVSVTLRAEMGDNQPAVCYAIDHVVTTGGNCKHS